MTFSHYIQEMYIITDTHITRSIHPSFFVNALFRHFFPKGFQFLTLQAEQMKECAERIKSHFQRLENERESKVQNVDAGEGTGRCPPTKAVACWNCKTLSATMVWNPCGHMCLCFECDNKVSECPICNNKKLSSFMVNLPVLVSFIK